MIAPQTLLPKVDHAQKLNGHSISPSAEPAPKKPVLQAIRYRWIVTGLAGVFVAALALRVCYISFFSDLAARRRLQENFFESVENLPKNYASVHNGSTTPGEEKKFEKIAFVKVGTSEFKKDKASVEKIVNRFNAVIQYDKNAGIKDDKESHLLIAVSPPHFDSLSTVVQRLGRLIEKDVTSIDRTAEYRRLVAKKASLEQSMASLIGLKSSFPEASNLNLRTKFLEVQTGLQEVESDLAYFTADNDFCTLKLSLYEVPSANATDFVPAVQSSFGWTVHYYPYFLFLAIASLVFKFFDKLKMPTINLGRFKP